MRRDAFTQDDLRNTPAYGIPEAAGYLRLPVSTLRAWMLGQRYRVRREPKVFRPVIGIADRKNRQLSFINLVEAFVLAAVRRDRQGHERQRTRQSARALPRRNGPPRRGAHRTAAFHDLPRCHLQEADLIKS